MKNARKKSSNVGMWTAGIAATFISALYAADYELNYSLITAGPTSNTGTQTLCLPYDLPSGLANASDLMDELNVAAGGGQRRLDFQVSDHERYASDVYGHPARK